MLERQVVIPASPEELWVALTDPSEVAQWFGSEVDWDLRPGGRARFTEADGSIRRGLVESVFPGRRLSFRWWREEVGDTDTSRVTYTLEPEEDGTRLTVTEQPVAVPPCADVGAPSHSSSGSDTGTASPATASVRPVAGAEARPVTGGAVPSTSVAESWTHWDTRMFQCWARAGAVAVTVARSGRR